MRYALDELAEPSKQFYKNRQFASFTTNLDVAGKLAAEVLDDRELAHDYSQQALEHLGDIDHWWALQEHLWREAEYYQFTGKNDLKINTVIQALKIHERWPAVLEPSAGESAIERGNLVFMVDNLGIDRAALGERGLIIEPTQVLPLGLSQRAIDRVVNNVRR